MIEPVFPLAPKITYSGIRYPSPLVSKTVHVRFSFLFEFTDSLLLHPDASGQSRGLDSELKANAIIRLNAERYDIRLS